MARTTVSSNLSSHVASRRPIRTGVFACAAGIAVALTAAGAGAAVIEADTYQMLNHPDGNAASPHYGLRLDELINVSGGHDIFTFDFNHEQSDMRLTLTEDGGIRIHGVAFGGLDIGSSYDATYSGLVEIEFEYNTVEEMESDDDLIVQSANFTNTGTITLWTGEEIDLFDYAGNHGYTFRLGNEDNDNGHRGFNGVSGWGWVDHHVAGSHVASSDWLFTLGQPIPGPATLAAFALLGARGRRRRNA